jgi:alkanesulfonate monooxygenase SsuD/methylene tetrahydromethanopterin reductase-like flavin-dependent oxidoreductase (luciferase family)
LYPNRIDLGLSSGTDQHTARALQRDDQPAFEFKTVKELQNYLSVDNRTSQVRAIPGEGLDILIGSSTESAKLAATFGLPYAFASHFAPQQLKEALHIYRSISKLRNI